MNRIVLMLLKNPGRLPGLFWKMHRFKKHPDQYSEEEKYLYLREFFRRVMKSGHIEIEAYGIENIPKENGFMLYANHQGRFDFLAVSSHCDMPVRLVLAKELYRIPLLKQLADCTHSFAMDRQDPKQSVRVILGVIEEVKKGYNYLIFPEGIRSRGEAMGTFHHGSFRPAVKTQCPILPIALIDTYKVLDGKGSKPVKVQVHYLPPVFYEEYKDMTTVELSAFVQERIGTALAGVYNAAGSGGADLP